MDSYEIQYFSNGVACETVIDATNILIAIGLFLDETSADLKDIASISC